MISALAHDPAHHTAQRDQDIHQREELQRKTGQIEQRQKQEHQHQAKTAPNPSEGFGGEKRRGAQRLDARVWPGGGMARQIMREGEVHGEQRHGHQADNSERGVEGAEFSGGHFAAKNNLRDEIEQGEEGPHDGRLTGLVLVSENGAAKKAGFSGSFCDGRDIRIHEANSSAACIQRRKKAAPSSKSRRRMNSSFVWACAMEPGPTQTAGHCGPLRTEASENQGAVVNPRASLPSLATHGSDSSVSSGGE